MAYLTHCRQVGISTCEQADDGERLIMEYFDAIRDSPSHIYHSALPFSPSSSWIRRCYEPEVAGEARALMELPDKWGECSRTIPLEGYPGAFAHWGDTIAVGIKSDVVLLDAVAGVRTSVLSDNTGMISYLEFSQGGTLLLSNNYQGFVKLWDVQTGGVIRTFGGGHSADSAISISPDGTTIALGTFDGEINLWNVRTRTCNSIKTGEGRPVNHIRFSPVDSRRFISSSTCGTIQQWDVDGHPIGPSYKGGSQDLAYAPDGTRFVSCGKGVATVQDSESGAVVAELNPPGFVFTCRCCFSSDGQLVAFSIDNIIHVWDITIPGARLVRRLPGHSQDIDFIDFPSYLISVSSDKSIKFWQSSSFFVGSNPTEHIAALQCSMAIRSVSLFAKDSTVVTSDESGVVRTWDLITGRCKSSFRTPARGPRDTQLADGTLLLVWWEDEWKWYHIWDVGRGRLLQRFRSSFDSAEDEKISGDVDEGQPGLNSSFYGVEDVKISGDGSKIFGVCGKNVEVVSTQTGDVTSRLEIKVEGTGPFRLVVRGSKLGIDNLCRSGWDFGGCKASDFGRLSNQLRLDLADPPSSSRKSLARPITRWIVDTVTGRQVFRLPERYIKPSTEVIWDGQYLLIWSPSGEVVVVNFDCVVQTLPTALSDAFSRLTTFL